MTAGDGTKDCDRAHKQQKEWAHSISPNVASGFSFVHLSSQGRVRHYPYDQLTAGAMPAGAARGTPFRNSWGTCFSRIGTWSRIVVAGTAYTAVIHISKSQARSVGSIFWVACIPHRIAVAAVRP